MRYRKLGRYGIRVSEVSLGGWLTQGRTIDDATSSEIIHRAFDLGVNLFDSADVYNRGAAEETLGKAIKALRRSDVVLATKCFFPMSDGPNDRGLSRKHIFESVHASLRRLDTDYIDLYQFHRFDPETPVGESIRAIDDLIRQGKVLYWGVSEWTGAQIREAYGIAERLNANPPASNQPRYNMLTRAIETEILPAAKDSGMGSIVFSPLAQGVLTGKYLPGVPPAEGTRGASQDKADFMRDLISDENLTRVQRLKAFSEELGIPLERLALAWCLRRPEISSVITGATNVAQLEANVAASGVDLDPEVWARAKAALG